MVASGTEISPLIFVFEISPLPLAGELVLEISPLAIVFEISPLPFMREIVQDLSLLTFVFEVSFRMYKSTSWQQFLP